MKTIHTVLKGQKEYSPELMEAMMTSKNPLSNQEILVLQAAARRLSSKEIAQKLYLSHGTIRNYMSSILTKLAAKKLIRSSLDCTRKWLDLIVMYEK